MLDRKFVREHPAECSYLVNRFMVEHLVRVNQAFDGDFDRAIVLGTIGQYNLRWFYDEIVLHSTESLEELIARGAHLSNMRPCNAMSVSSSTGIPRETVRRKISWLIDKQWVREEGRGKLYITAASRTHFKTLHSELIATFFETVGRLQRAEVRAGGRGHGAHSTLPKRIRSGAG
jgi:hypothetical protein